MLAVLSRVKVYYFCTPSADCREDVLIKVAIGLFLEF